MWVDCEGTHTIAEKRCKCQLPIAYWSPSIGPVCIENQKPRLIVRIAIDPYLWTAEHHAGADNGAVGKVARIDAQHIWRLLTSVSLLFPLIVTRGKLCSRCSGELSLSEPDSQGAREAVWGELRFFQTLSNLLLKSPPFYFLVMLALISYL